MQRGKENRVLEAAIGIVKVDELRVDAALETPAVTKGSFLLALREPPTSAAGVRGWSSALETPCSTTTSLKTPGAIMRELRKQQESTFPSEMDDEDAMEDSWLFHDAPFQNCDLEKSPKGRDARLPSVRRLLPIALTRDLLLI